MSVPERVWINPGLLYRDSRGPRWWEAFESQDTSDDIPYRRETVCEWGTVGDRAYGYAHGRRIDTYTLGTWKYCPYCGGTIRIVGQEEE